ncbi:hypothetical protein [Methanogenium sp. MK-MG]|uniref:DUF7289 family protein n=1 Tax=Methanogenium sp. MK-MG TaxID=2599926 RepID=UPI0013EBB4D4|nr:hypothetical protein [Methanogenium sp. MK-MG]KAF1077931.1 hypothetical protein MKMG_01141 [Methanogenium sp. MK-MG]
MKTCMRKDESGVSEAIGFILIFTIVILGISIVTLYGYPVLADAKISSDEKIMEQNMIVLQNDIKILTRNNVPYRDTTIGVSGGSIFVTNSTTSGNEGGEHFTLTYFNTSSGAMETTEYYPGSLEFVSGEGTAVVSVSNGAVVKRQQDQDGSSMISNPRWFYDETEGTLVIFMTSITSPQEMTLGGIGTIQMAMLDAPEIHDFKYAPGTPEVKIEYFPDLDDDYSRAWENYLTGPFIVQGGFSMDVPTGNPGDPDIYRLNVNRLVIKEYTVEILGI